MATIAFLGEIQMVSFSFAPKGWAMCNGQFMPINQNQGLFALLGTTYGGNGQTTFALPDLRGRIPIHMGSGHTLGEAAGQASHTITAAEMPIHTHTLNATSVNGDLIIASGNQLAASPSQLYQPPDNNLAAMNPASVSNTGGSQAHQNMMPFLGLNFVICLSGEFPSQS